MRDDKPRKTVRRPGVCLSPSPKPPIVEVVEPHARHQDHPRCLANKIGSPKKRYAMLDGTPSKEQEKSGDIGGNATREPPRKTGGKF